ncbi:membrane protein [Streptomyces toyocaensis]|uniref:Membrane protein n=1 Tax=Streptomyces toyocaensis TaxID=55952 RepID=A0A081XZY3_STRTO|nr:hypothetical protein [Streptomyces toyocaensis]KES09106.1 membrane protein [Streptomyces toyocaensis]
MSTRSSPYASGPPPRGDQAPEVRNPLIRTSDRVECWVRRALMVVLVVGLPLAGLLAGRAAQESSSHAARAQSAERQQVGARVLSVTGNPGQPAKERAQVRWTDSGGEVRTATALLSPGTAEGATVRVWVDRDGTVTRAPLTERQAVTNGWFVGSVTVIGGAAGVFMTRAGTRLVLDRRRYARWDAEWELVEPRWTGRFRR